MLKRIIYISGSGRSGSTVLERLLASVPSVQGLGELHVLWRLPLDQITCSCGSGIPNESFWQEAMKTAGIGNDELMRLGALERKIVRSNFVAQHRFDLTRLSRDPRTREFLDLQFRLFEAISFLTGASTLIDSSKAAPRAWLLASDPRVHLIHLYRRPQDVIASWRSKKFDKGLDADMQRLSILEAAADWAKPELLIRRLAKQVRVGFLNYLDFSRSPRSAVAAALGGNLRTLISEMAWTDETSFQPRLDFHSLNGNPDRFDNSIIRIAPRQPSIPLSAWDRIGGAIIGSALSFALPFPSRECPRAVATRQV